MSRKFLALFLSVSIVLSIFLFSIPVSATSDIEGSPVSFAEVDFDSDGLITMNDVIELAKAFNTKVGDENYRPKFDLNKDSVINMADILIWASYFGKVVTGAPTRFPTSSPEINF